MNMKICLMPGDGIGPGDHGPGRAVCWRGWPRSSATLWRRRRRSSAAWPSTRWQPVPSHGGGLQGRRRRAAGRRGRPQVGHHATCGHPALEGFCWDTQAAVGLFANLRPLRSSPSWPRRRTCGRTSSARAWTSWSCARADGRRLYSRAQGRDRGPRGAGGLQHDDLLRVPVERIVRVACEIARKRGKRCSRWTRPTSTMCRGAVARGGHPHGGAVPGRGAVAHVRGQRGHAAHPRPFAVRRHRHREPVRRHPFGRGSIITGSIACCPRRPWGRAARPVRAHPRLGPGHRRRDAANPLATILSVSMMRASPSPWRTRPRPSTRR